MGSAGCTCMVCVLEYFALPFCCSRAAVASALEIGVHSVSVVLV